MRTLHKADRTLPSLKVIRRWREEQPAFDRFLTGAAPLGVRRRHARRRQTAAADSDLAWDVLDVVSDGKSLHQIGKTPGMPGHWTLYRRWAKDPEFARRLSVSRRIGFEELMEEGEPLVGVRGKARERDRIVHRARTLWNRAERKTWMRKPPYDLD